MFAITADDILAGKKGEKLFMQILGRLKLPFLYIRQEKGTRFNRFEEHQESCNPDFQVHMHGLGNPYFDVKVRQIHFLNFEKGRKEDGCFRLNNNGDGGNGLDEVVAFQRQWLAPVWLAFVERNLVDAGKPGVFYLVSIDSILTHHHALKMRLGQERLDKLPFICFPMKLMQLVNNETGLSLKTDFPTAADIEAWAEMYVRTSLENKAVDGKQWGFISSPRGCPFDSTPYPFISIFR